MNFDPLFIMIHINDNMKNVTNVLKCLLCQQLLFSILNFLRMEDTLCNMCDNIIISVIKETSFVVNVQFLEFLYKKQYVFVFLGIKSTNVTQKNLYTA